MLLISTLSHIKYISNVFSKNIFQKYIERISNKRKRQKNIHLKVLHHHSPISGSSEHLLNKRLYNSRRPLKALFSICKSNQRKHEIKNISKQCLIYHELSNYLAMLVVFSSLPYIKYFHFNSLWCHQITQVHTCFSKCCGS